MINKEFQYPLISSELIDSIMNKLGFTDQTLIKRNIEHFTENEGTNRDQIVRGYFGIEGMDLIINNIIDNIQPLSSEISLLDLGVGSGTFLVPIIDRTKLKNISALDATPLMLELLSKKIDKNQEIKMNYILGDMENVLKSINLNNQMRDTNIPTKFNRIISTLALHHIPKTDKVLQSIYNTLSEDGIAIIIDTIKGKNKDKIDPEHAHNGFDRNKLVEMSEIYFNDVEFLPLSVTCGDNLCDSAGNQLFLLKLSEKK